MEFLKHLGVSEETIDYMVENNTNENLFDFMANRDNIEEIIDFINNNSKADVNILLRADISFFLNDLNGFKKRVGLED